MADTMQFDLVSPERRLASVEASEVQIPGSEGDMTAMPDHTPTITNLRPGLLRVVGSEGTQEYLVTGGFAEITATSASVLAEHAVSRDELTQDIIDGLVSDANEARDNATAENKDAAVKFVADIAVAAELVGFSARS
ncbi:MAG: F0F1 ATP synthase subunit epsilon [Marinosulfonomonas sp.]|nr:F0F1 ATP synthase subunit epsilon [Marinosulfonomonas sp.]